MFVTSERSVVNVVRICKVVAGQSCRVTVQSSQPQMVASHWFGRQLVCPGADCPACEAYQTRVSAFFLGTLFTGKVWVPAMFEVCPSEVARVRFMASWEEGKMEPGLCITMSRKNARSSLRCEPLPDGGGPILPALDDGRLLLRSVCRLLQLPPLLNHESETEWQARVMPILAGRLSHAIATVG